MIFGNPSVLLIATQYLCNGCHLCHGPCHVPAPLLSYGTAQNPHTSPLIYQVAPFCPACHFGILVFPDLLLKDGAIYLSLDNIPLLTILFIAPIVIRAKSLGAATICGGTVYYILQEWL